MDTVTLNWWIIYVVLVAFGAVCVLFWLIYKSPPTLTQKNRVEVAKSLYEFFLEEGT